MQAHSVAFRREKDNQLGGSEGDSPKITNIVKIIFAIYNSLKDVIDKSYLHLHPKESCSLRKRNIMIKSFTRDI